ncbi:MAG TPA: LytTR family DNA-binding domain-containing protein [Flavisolibacter sp.]|jgi:hypothetical protein|nr:LytTR family DNA-binding domain-containing protein [Flavisolibacter sp.]
MTLWIVENDKKKLRLLSKMICLMDASAEITEAFPDITSLNEKLKSNKAPSLILVNQNLTIVRTPLLNNRAKIILPTKDYTLVYIAFCIEEGSDHTDLIGYGTETAYNSGIQINGSLPNTWSTEQTILTKAYKSRFLVMNGQKMQSIPVENIAYFFADERFVFFMTFDKQKFLVEYKVEELEQALDPNMFFRINRAFIISINALDSIHPYFGSRFKLKLNPHMNKDVIVSRHRSTSFKAWLGE